MNAALHYYGIYDYDILIDTCYALDIEDAIFIFTSMGYDIDYLLYNYMIKRIN